MEAKKMSEGKKILHLLHRRRERDVGWLIGYLGKLRKSVSKYICAGAGVGGLKIAAWRAVERRRTS